MAKKFFVPGDQYYRITGQILEIQRQLRMKGGSPLDPKKVRTALQKIIDPAYKEWTDPREFPVGSDTPDSVLARIRSYGYLDTSFDGGEVRPLIIRSLTKAEALSEYRKSGGKTWVFDKMERNMPYRVPKEETLNVMILDFGKEIEKHEALDEMDMLGVRPLFYEGIIQYGIAYPEHQKQKELVGLDGRPDFDRHLLAQVLGFGVESGRCLGAIDCDRGFSSKCRFLVIPK